MPTGETGFVVVWREPVSGGRIEVTYGTLARLAAGGKQRGDGAWSEPADRIEGQVQGAALQAGARATRVSVRAGERAFTFFLRDVSKDSPILVPELGVAVVPAGDART